MDVDACDGIEEADSMAKPFFGERPRALQPLLKRNKRRHEFHAQLSSPSSSLIQVKAIRQKLNGACGYYSLFHSSMSVLARQCIDDELARWIASQMFNKAMFFVMMANWKQQLLEESRRRNSIDPNFKSSFGASNWRFELIRTGVMERTYMEHLLATDEWILAIRRGTETKFHALPEISLSQLKSRLSLATLKTVDEISKELAKDGCEKPHVFLIGQLNHWIAIISNRVSQTRFLSSSQMDMDDPHSMEMEMTKSMDLDDDEGDSSLPSSLSTSQPSRLVETILLDSRNDFVLNLHGEDITKRVDKRVFKEWGFGIFNNPTGKSPTLWQELCMKLYEQSLRDTQYSCHMFHKLSQQFHSPSTASKSSPNPAISSSSSSSSSGVSSKSSKSKSKKSDADPNQSSPPHPITTDLILLYVNGFFEGFAKHVGDMIEVGDPSMESTSSGGSFASSAPSINGQSVQSAAMDVSSGEESKLEKRKRSKSGNSKNGHSDKVRGYHGDINEWLFKFVVWVQEYSPLRTIEDNFVFSLRNAKKAGYFVPSTVPDALERWTDVLKARIAQAQKEKAVSEDAEAIIEDLFENTLPYVLSSAKYLRRKS
jgi:hypothetical protein